MSTPEAKVKAAIRKWLREHGFWRAGDDRPERLAGWYYMPQNMGMGANGIPDFIGSTIDEFLGARPWGIEAKARGNTPTALQLDRHEEMRATGWQIFVIDDVSKLSELEAICG